LRVIDFELSMASVQNLADKLVKRAAIFRDVCGVVGLHLAGVLFHTSAPGRRGKTARQKQREFIGFSWFSCRPTVF